MMRAALTVDDGLCLYETTDVVLTSLWGKIRRDVSRGAREVSWGEIRGFGRIVEVRRLSGSDTYVKYRVRVRLPPTCERWALYFGSTLGGTRITWHAVPSTIGTLKMVDLHVAP